MRHFYFLKGEYKLLQLNILVMDIIQVVLYLIAFYKNSISSGSSLTKNRVSQLMRGYMLWCRLVRGGIFFMDNNL